MTSLVFCRGCAHQIHETATSCPKCGAPQVILAKSAATTPAASPAPAIHSYAQVPWYRKRWFAGLCIFLFVPAYLLIAFTGDVYFEKNGELKTISKNEKFIVLGIFIILILIRIVRQ
jgi:hypothetical protein